VLAGSRRIIDMQIRSVGIDLGKTTFQLAALSAAGKVLLRKKFTQKQLITFTANPQISLIGMEACSGAHFLGRALREQGHEVKLIPAARRRRSPHKGRIHLRRSIDQPFAFPCSPAADHTFAGTTTLSSERRSAGLFPSCRLSKSYAIGGLQFITVPINLESAFSLVHDRLNGRMKLPFSLP
jgi:hypothetical protein